MAKVHVHETHPEITKRLKRAEGHLRSVIAMIDAGRPCLDLAQQLHAVEKAIGQAKKIVTAAEGGNIGWESSAYDAWASQESLTVYTQCMANRAGKAGDAMIAARP